MYKAGQRIILKLRSEVREQADKYDLPTSFNDAIGTDNIFILDEKNPPQAIQAIINNNKVWHLKGPHGANYGWVYEHEIGHVVSGPPSNIKSIQELEEELKKLKEEHDNLADKLNWIHQTGATEFDENEFKVYQVLKALDKKGITFDEKTKLIASFISTIK